MRNEKAKRIVSPWWLALTFLGAAHLASGSNLADSVVPNIAEPKIAEFSQRIRNKIERRWFKPLKMDHKGATVTVSLGSDGDVVRAEISKTSGIDEYDFSVIRAVYKASPLPLPADSSLRKKFRQIALAFGAPPFGSAMSPVERRKLNAAFAERISRMGKALPARAQGLEVGASQHVAKSHSSKDTEQLQRSTKRKHDQTANGEIAALTLGAQQGGVDAQYQLGIRYLNGTRVSRDAVTAVDWLLRAAEQGHASAQGLVGTLYRDGRGVEKNHKFAEAWLTRAAEQGDTKAQLDLARLIWVSQTNDLVRIAEAEYWARSSLKEAGKPNQRSEAKSLLAEILPAKEHLAKAQADRMEKERLEEEQLKKQGEARARLSELKNLTLRNESWNVAWYAPLRGNPAEVFVDDPAILQLLDCVSQSGDFYVLDISEADDKPRVWATLEKGGTIFEIIIEKNPRIQQVRTVALAIDGVAAKKFNAVLQLELACGNGVSSHIVPDFYSGAWLLNAFDQAQ